MSSEYNTGSVFFSVRLTRPKDKTKVALQRHLFTGLAMLFSLVAVVFLVLYFANLKDSPVALWSVIGLFALALFFIAWKFFRNNGALLVGELVA
jgi:uncharacterized membrane protein YqjE